MKQVHAMLQMVVSQRSTGCFLKIFPGEAPRHHFSSPYAMNWTAKEKSGKGPGTSWAETRGHPMQHRGQILIG